MSDTFPNLQGFCGSYFHQDWGLDDPTAEAVVDRYICDATPEEVQQLASEIATFLRLEMSEKERAAVLDGFGCGYYPPGDGVSYSEWPRQVHKLLIGER